MPFLTGLDRMRAALASILGGLPVARAKRPGAPTQEPEQPASSVLIVGPSSSGKSTLIASDDLVQLGLSRPKVVFGHRLRKTDVPDNALIHYNMLYQARLRSEDPQFANTPMNLAADQLLNKLLRSGRLQEAVVIVAPIDELLARMRERSVVEENGKNVYDRSFWIDTVERLDLFRLYENLFDLLEREDLPYRVMFSSSSTPNQFAASDRVFTYANLRGRYVVPPERAEIAKVMAHPGCQYQRIKLPHGLSTSAKGNRHLGKGRAETFDLILPADLRGSSILDIGCALGDLLYTAERLGATRLVGIELNPDRFDAACQIKDLLCSGIEVHQCDFLDFEITEPFDHVFALNVIHHVSDFRSFIEKAAAAAMRTLTLEFPTLMDEKFRRAHGLEHASLEPLNELPIIGLSLRSAGQSFVYSPEAIRQLVMIEIGGFSSCKLIESPIANRNIMIFYK